MRFVILSLMYSYKGSKPKPVSVFSKKTLKTVVADYVTNLLGLRIPGFIELY